MWLLALVSIAYATTLEIEVEGADSVRVRAKGEPAHIPVCRGVSWEVFDEEKAAFQALSGPPCGPSAPAVEVGVDGLLYTFDATLAGAQSGRVSVVRAVVVYGEKCSFNKPFSLSQCADIRRVYGPNIVIHPSG